MAAPPTYTTIPPPPLPEFYLNDSNAGSDCASSSLSSRSKSNAKSLVKLERQVKQAERSERITQTVALYDYPAPRPDGNDERLPPAPGDATDEKMIETRRRLRVPPNTITIPPPPPGPEATVPPLAIYHICRICLRPRSPHYHREHPIPINGVPPPPGICRRCRVKHVGDVATVREVIAEVESDPVKLGIACIMPDECYIPGKEWKERRDRQILEAVDRRNSRVSESAGAEKLITYRHILVREASPVAPPAVKPAPDCTPQDAIDTISIRHKATTPTPVPAEIVQKRSSVSNHSVRVIKVRQIDTVGASKSVQVASSSSDSSGDRAARFTKPDSTHERPGYSESDIRKFAREEVERYRQAERKLEAHPDAFAHGRMVPVARRISCEADTEATVPWTKRADSVTLRIARPIEAAIDPRPSRRPEPARYHEETERLEEVTSVTMPRTSTQISSSSSSSSSSEHHRPKEGRQTILERIVQQGPQKATKTCRGASGSQPAQPGSLAPAKIRLSEPQSTASDKTRWARSNDKAPGRNVLEQVTPSGIEVRRIYAVADERNAPSNVSHRTSTRMREVWAPAPDTAIEVESPMAEVGLKHQAYDRSLKLRDKASGEIQTPVASAPETLRSSVAGRYQSEQRTSAPSAQPSYAAASERYGSQNVSAHWEQRSVVSAAKESDRVYFVDNSAVPPQSHHSTMLREHEATAVDASLRYRSAPARAAEFDEQESLPQSRSKRESRRGVPDEEEAPNDNVRPRAFDRRWEEAERKSEASKARSLQGSQAGSAKNKAQQSTKPPSGAGRSSRSERPADREYIYTERMVEPVVASSTREWSDRISSSHSVKRDAPPRERQDSRQHEPKAGSARHQETKAREWEDSSHVRFSSKVDISPTPPGSQASSSEFRIIGGRGSKGRLDGQEERGEDLIAEYERRGRVRSRSRAGEGEYHWERDEVHTRESRTQGLQRAFSESPSRERIENVGREAEVDSYGPYRAPEPRTDSYDVQDGSNGARQWADPERGGSSRHSAATASTRGERRQ